MHVCITMLYSGTGRFVPYVTALLFVPCFFSSCALTSELLEVEIIHNFSLLVHYVITRLPTVFTLISISHMGMDIHQILFGWFCILIFAQVYALWTQPLIMAILSHSQSIIFLKQ